MRACKCCLRVRWVDVIRSAVVRRRQTRACYMFRNDNCPCCECCNFPSRQNHLTHSFVEKCQTLNPQIFCQIDVLRNHVTYIFICVQNFKLSIVLTTNALFISAFGGVFSFVCFCNARTSPRRL
jgi:hypothetical protein